MNEYMQQRRRMSPQQQAGDHAARMETAYPNSALLGASSGYANPELDTLMRERAERHQIPAAEQEADRLSAGVQATTFEGVRNEMSRRLGADLSGVRLHTDGASAERADQMGAEAFASGRDIYFGSEGFNPQTAAHELVHTVQQGAAPGGGVSVSAPMGGVQMKKKKPSLRNKFAYRGDKDYQTIRKMLKEYNSEEGGKSAKDAREQAILIKAARYIDQYSTGEKAKHKGRTSELEQMMMQLMSGGSNHSASGLGGGAALQGSDPAMGGTPMPLAPQGGDMSDQSYRMMKSAMLTDMVKQHNAQFAKKK